MPRIPFESAVPEPKTGHVEDLGVERGYRRLVLRTERGPVELRLYEAEGARSAAVFLGGVGGGFDSPASGLFPRLAEELASQGVSALRVRYRKPTDLAESAHDALAGLRLLRARGVARVALVGHSFGGAVAVRVAARAPEVATVVALATQSYGTEEVAQLSPRPLLLLHGTDDEILPPTCSWTTYRMAREPKEFKLLEGAHHGLEEMAEEVYALVGEWLSRHLLLSPRWEAQPRA